MPAARGQAAEQGRFRGLPIEMKRLRIELRGERLDVRLVDAVRATDKALSNGKVIEKKRLCRRSARVEHGCDLHYDSDSAILCQCSEKALAGWCVRLPAASSAWASGGASSFCAM